MTYGDKLQQVFQTLDRGGFHVEATTMKLTFVRRGNEDQARRLCVTIAGILASEPEEPCVEIPAVVEPETPAAAVEPVAAVPEPDEPSVIVAHETTAAVEPEPEPV